MEISILCCIGFAILFPFLQVRFPAMPDTLFWLIVFLPVLIFCFEELYKMSKWSKEKKN